MLAMTLFTVVACGGNGESGKDNGKSGSVVNVDASSNGEIKISGNMLTMPDFVGMRRGDITAEQFAFVEVTEKVTATFEEIYEAGGLYAIIRQYPEAGSIIDVSNNELINVNIVIPNYEVIIPNLVGMRYSDVESNTIYTNLGNVGYFDIMTSDTVEEGYIISQDPPAEKIRNQPQQIDDRITFRLVISSGVEPAIEMPDLTGLHYAEAQNNMIRLGHGHDIDVIVESVPSNEKRFYVFETIPKAGEDVSHGDTVIIRYSGG